MTILFLSKYYFPHIGGVEKHLEKISSRLQKKGHKITVLTLKHDPKLSDFETRRGVKIIRIPSSENKLSLWKSIWQKRSLIKNADIVHCHDVFFWYLPLRFLYPTKPVYTTFHGWEGKYPVPKKIIKVRKLSEKLSWGNICVGDFIKKHYGTKPGFVTYGGVDNGENMGKNRSKNIRDCVFIGRLDKVNGIEEYLETLKRIKQEFNLKITFIGDGPYRTQAEKLGQVTGMVDNMKKYLTKPTYIFASSYLTILESMAKKRPVFALYSNPLKKDYLKFFPGARFMRISGNPEELYSHFKNAVKNPKKIDSMINKAYSFANTQTWDKVTKMYLKLWNNES